MPADIIITSNAWEVADKLGVLQTLLIPNLMVAMSQSLDWLEYKAVNYMFTHFEFNPRPSTGVLEGGFIHTITPAIDSLTGELSNPVAYAWRREEGFTGMTDSLGRTYIKDPRRDASKHYMANTLGYKVNQAQIVSYFKESLQVSLVGMGIVQ